MVQNNSRKDPEIKPLPKIPDNPHINPEIIPQPEKDKPEHPAPEIKPAKNPEIKPGEKDNSFLITNTVLD